MAKSNSKPSIAPIAWDADQQALTWALLNELEKYENFKVLFGKKDPKEVSLSFQMDLACTDSMLLHLEHLR